MTDSLFIERYYDFPNYPDAVVLLIDALCDYLRADDDMLCDGLTVWANEKERRDHDIHIQSVTLLMKELKSWNLNSSLNGMIRSPR